MTTPGTDLSAAVASTDFDFFFGAWTVSHRRLKDRLVGSQEWEEFTGACETWPVLGGLGNVDDNLLHLPAGAYRALTLRKFDAEAGLWSIWWLDGRSSAIEPPVHGGFSEGTGIFYGDDIYRDTPIKVRFTWSHTATAQPRWEQAFSVDDGRTWEVNWTMEFSRPT